MLEQGGGQSILFRVTYYIVLMCTVLGLWWKTLSFRQHMKKEDVDLYILPEWVQAIVYFVRTNIVNLKGSTFTDH